VLLVEGEPMRTGGPTKGLAMKPRRKEKIASQGLLRNAVIGRAETTGRVIIFLKGEGEEDGARLDGLQKADIETRVVLKDTSGVEEEIRLKCPFETFSKEKCPMTPAIGTATGRERHLLAGGFSGARGE